jgi:hypothetical protein
MCGAKLNMPSGATAQRVKEAKKRSLKKVNLAMIEGEDKMDGLNTIQIEEQSQTKGLKRLNQEGAIQHH